MNHNEKKVASDTETATIEGLQENQIENKAKGNKNSSAIGDAEIMGAIPLEDT